MNQDKLDIVIVWANANWFFSFYATSMAVPVDESRTHVVGVLKMMQ